MNSSVMTSSVMTSSVMTSSKSTWYEWHMYKAIRNIILNHGATIFGGAVRDEIYHNINADQFYKEEAMYILKNKKNPKAPKFNYNNVKISPHTIGRLTIPNDIDFYIKSDDLDKMLNILTKHYYIKVVSAKELKYVMPNVDINKYKKIVIEIIEINNNKIYKIKLDVISCLTLEVPPLVHDFDVNSLLWNNDLGIYTIDYMTGLNINSSTYKLINFNKIMENIKNKNAYVMQTFIYNQTNMLPKKEIWENRFIKMLRAGWNINVTTIYYNFYTNIPKDNMCIICSASVSENICNSYANFKNCNCNVFICLSCIKNNYIKLDKCPLCRESIFENVSLVHDNLLREISLFDMLRHNKNVRKLFINVKLETEPTSNSEPNSELDV